MGRLLDVSSQYLDAAAGADNVVGAAVALFGVGDLATTIHGLSQPGGVERNPVGVLALGLGGYAGLVVVKAAVMAATAAVTTLFPDPARQGIPMGLALIGGLIIVWSAGVVFA